MLLNTQEILYINSITHEDKVVLFGTDIGGKIWYSIKQDGFEESYLNTPPNERTGWENWQELEFPNEAEDDISVIEKETKEYTRQNNPNEFILRSRYRTQDQSAVAPVQLVSGMEYLYVFRQSKQNTLLCDRYVLDGSANKLVRKSQARFKHSGQRFKASEEIQQTEKGLKNVDSLDDRDANDKAFYEPTTELSFIDNLDQGWFAVIQLPMLEQAKYCWNIFAWDSQSQKIHLYSFRVSQDGLFEVHDYSIFEPKSEEDPTLISRSIPGIIKRTLDLNVEIGNGISATKFYVQSSQETDAGTRLMRDATRVMLSLVTSDEKVATINFAALSDGTLSKIGDMPTTEILRNNIQEVLLPQDTLDNIKGTGIVEPPPEGTITAFNRTVTDGVTRTHVSSPEASILKNGQEIIIDNTQDYNGYYTITKIDNTTFEIDAPWATDESANNQLGCWKVVPVEEQVLIFDGLIVGYERTAGGKLRVSAENHGLENGDGVQAFDTTSYDGIYSITKIDDQTFIINHLRWQTGEAVKLKLESQKRQGIIFDGKGDYISLPDNTDLQIESYTVEVWIKPQKGGPAFQGIVGKPGRNFNIWFHINGFIHHRFHTSKSINDGIPNTPNGSIQWDQWNHVAITNDGTTAKTYINGVLKMEGPVKGPLIVDKTPLYFACSLEGKKQDFFKGEMADVRIWKTVRNAKEIKNSMYLQLTGKESNLVGYWRLGDITIDEDNERKVIDFSVNQNNATVFGDSHTEAANLKRLSQKRLGIVFDGRGDYMSLPDNTDLQIESYTVEVWIKPQKGGPAFQGIVGKPGRNFNIWFHINGFIHHRFHTSKSINDGIPNTPNGSIQWDQWNHVAITNDGTTAKTYINGVLKMEGPVKGPLIVDKTPLYFACSLEGKKQDFFKGEMADVRIWKTVRNAKEIKNSMYLQLTGKESNLVGYWRLGDITIDEDNERKVIDFSVNQNNATVFGDSHTEAANLKRLSQKRQGTFFDGKGDYMSLPDNPDLQIESYTVEVWIKPQKGGPAFQGIVGKPGRNFNIWFHINGFIHHRFHTSKSINDGIPNTPNGSIQWDQWNHVAITNDGTTAKTYINGVLKIESPVKGPLIVDKTPLYFACHLEGKKQDFFKGEMADVRIWKVVRSAKEIKDSMYLRLTGKESNLVGYWRLSDIVVDEDHQRKVIDFSVNQNNATVFGDSHVSIITLNRCLEDGTTDAVEYSNRELFAVTQQATYEETFEFTINQQEENNSTVTQGSSVGSSQQLFHCTYWGKKTLLSKDKISFPGGTTEIKPAVEKGWFVASCRFTVPEEVNLVRYFQVSNVTGSWKTLQLRRHRIRNISDVIIKANYTDTVALTSLGMSQREVFSQLTQLQQKELEEQTLLKKKAELEEQLAVLNAAPDTQMAIDNKQQAINQQQSLITSLKGEISNRYATYQKTVNNPLNYWCKISSFYQANNAIRIYEGIHRNLINTPSWDGGFKNQENQYFRFDKVGDAYTIICKYQNRILEMPTGYTWHIFGGTDHHKRINQQWKVIPISGGYEIRSKWGYRLMEWSIFDNSIIGNPVYNWQLNQRWGIEKIGEGITINDNIANAQKAWEMKKSDSQTAQKKLAELQQELVDLQDSPSDLSTPKDQLASDIAALADLIAAVQLQINSANSQIIATAQTQSEAQIMPKIASDGNLDTTGAILEFTDPASRVTTLETCEGTVQLSYFDQQGRLSQDVYDATADEVNSYFEQWLPDRTPICLNCDSNNKGISLSGEGLTIAGNWTIEASFVYPLPSTDQWNTLTGNASGDRSIGVKAGKYLGTDVNGTFYYCLPDSGLANQENNAYDLATLIQGWHHITVVGTTVTEDQTIIPKTLFYIDGQKVGECLAKNTSAIQHIGNIDTGGEAFGKFCEVRIWNLALKQTEILANSQVCLTGNEPGLLAYYPLNEGSGSQAQDDSGNGNHGNVSDANWWGNTKVVADPTSQVMSFDGDGDYIALPPASSGGAITIEAWVYNEDVKRNNHRLIDFGNGAGSDNLIVAWSETKGTMTLYGFHADQSSFIETTEVFPNKQWIHVAATVDSNGNAIIYWNGMLKASGTVNLPQNLSRNNRYIGKSNSEQDSYFQGKMADLRVWNVARTETEIQANMSQRLTGEEASLEMYLPLNQTYTEGSATKVFDLANGNHGTVYNAMLIMATPQVYKASTGFAINALPLDQGTSTVGSDSLVTSVEYKTYTVNPANRKKLAMMRRMFAYPTTNGVKVFTDKRIESLDLQRSV